MAHLETKLNTAGKSLLVNLATTKTEVKVRRRFQNPDGTFRFEEAIKVSPHLDFNPLDGEFVFKIHEQIPDHPLFPFYINLRNMKPYLLTEIAYCISRSIPQKTFTHCTGIPQTGELIAQEFSEVTGIPFIKLFEKVTVSSKRFIVPYKSAPSFTQITAETHKSVRLLCLDDVISQGNSHLEANRAAGGRSYKIAGHAVLWHRQQLSKQTEKKLGCPIYSPFNTTTASAYLLEEGLITLEQYEKALQTISLTGKPQG